MTVGATFYGAPCRYDDAMTFPLLTSGECRFGSRTDELDGASRSARASRPRRTSKSAPVISVSSTTRNVSRDAMMTTSADRSRQNRKSRWSTTCTITRRRRRTVTEDDAREGRRFNDRETLWSRYLTRLAIDRRRRWRRAARGRRSLLRRPPPPLTPLSSGTLTSVERWTWSPRSISSSVVMAARDAGPWASSRSTCPRRHAASWRHAMKSRSVRVICGDVCTTMVNIAPHGMSPTMTHNTL